MIRQSKELITFIDKNISNVEAIYKNSTNLLISQMAKAYLDEEIETYKNLDPYDKEEVIYEFPDTVNISKWNPSDIWIAYSNCYQLMVSILVSEISVVSKSRKSGTKKKTVNRTLQPLTQHNVTNQNEVHNLLTLET